MRVGVATDHGGFSLKQELVTQLRAAGHEIVDFGAHGQNPDDDYPDFVVPLGQAVANITPDKDTGIGDWKQEDIVELSRTGTKPDLDNVQGLMYEVIQGTSGGYKDMKKEDALAIAAYLKSLPAIKNKINK